MSTDCLSYHERCVRYEQDKALWIAAHPDATHPEYETAMKQLAAKWGI